MRSANKKKQSVTSIMKQRSHLGDLTPIIENFSYGGKIMKKIYQDEIFEGPHWGRGALP